MNPPEGYTDNIQNCDTCAYAYHPWNAWRNNTSVYCCHDLPKSQRFAWPRFKELSPCEQDHLVDCALAQEEAIPCFEGSLEMRIAAWYDEAQTVRYLHYCQQCEVSAQGVCPEYKERG